MKYIRKEFNIGLPQSLISHEFLFISQQINKFRQFSYIFYHEASNYNKNHKNIKNKNKN